MTSLLSDFLRDRIKKKSIPIGRVNGSRDVCLDDESSEEEDNETKPSGTDYAKQYVKEEMDRYAQCVKSDTLRTGGMTDIDDGLSDVSALEDVYKLANYPSIYSNYNFESTFVKKELPIDSFKSKILNLVNTNSVVVIQGSTGSGKSTQVPQYILDDCRANNKYCNIVVTQPRKIATITVCRRVCEERGWTIGTVCGYQIGLEKKINQDTILSYVTTGVLLQKLIMAKNLNQFTHIIIDEVHERNQELDFLLLVVRKFLFTDSPRTKVILMSATIDAEELAYYFRSQSGTKITKTISAPIVYVDKQSEFVNHIYYANHLHKLQPLPRFDMGNPEISPEAYRLLILLIGAFDKIDERDPATNEKIIGSVLVFLPGINEIEEAQKQLTTGVKQEKKIKWHIIPLHSSLPNDEQGQVFYKPKPGERKIILATNIAESSITVPDIYYVIDFCLTKVMVQDPETRFMSLVLEWASHVNCEQRAGRVGRVANGRVYRLVDSEFYQHYMKEKSIPEVLRAPLDRVVLQSKRLNLREAPKAILALALNPPDLSNIEATILGLKECGGLLKTCNGVTTVSDGDLTFLGLVMASLPIEVRLSKLIVLGHIFNCLKETIIIAAGCSIQNIFKTPFQRRYEAYRKQLVWADESSSDLITLLNLFKVWQACRRQNAFADARSEKHWCDMNYVSLKGLYEWNTLVIELSQRLKSLGIEETVGPRKPLLDMERSVFLKVIMCGAFYPNYFTRSADHGQIDERVAVKTIGGRDPFRCVYLSGLSPEQPGQLYVKQIKQLIQSGNDIETKVKVSFDGSSKIYIEFPNYKKPECVNIDGQQVITTIPGRIALPVYESVKKRQLKIPFEIKVLPDNEAWEYANMLKKVQEQHMIERQIRRSTSLECDRVDYNICDLLSTVLPSLDMQYIKIVITWKVDPSHFWCQNYSNDTSYILSVIEKQLNQYPLERIKNPNEIIVGDMYAARFEEDDKFYRCKVNIIDRNKVAYILFIDYGNMQKVSAHDLYKLPNTDECHVAPLAMECVLCNIQPKVDLGSSTIWSKRINEDFDKQTASVVLYGKVYSVVDDVVHLELYKTMPGSRNCTSLNQYLIDQGYAEWVEESFLSQENHKLRMSAQASECPNLEIVSLNSNKNNEVLTEDYNLDIEKMEKTKRVRLKGPFSPLEMRVYGVVKSSFNKNCDIEGTSVNSVLLDDDPQNPHTRLLVAAYVGQSMSGALRLRQTTLMPKITGFPMLMTLIFCPEMEPKVTEDVTRVGAILCGLGCNEETYRPYYPSHDIILPLDTELTIDVINNINKLRYFMNRGIQIMEDIYHKNVKVNEMIDIQRSVKQHLWAILNMKMKSAPPVSIKNAGDWKCWNTLYDPVKLTATTHANKSDIWPLLWFVELNNVSVDELTVKENLAQLRSMAEKVIPTEPIICNLCGKHLSTLSEVRLHLIDSEHKRLECEFKKKSAIDGNDYNGF